MADDSVSHFFGGTDATYDEPVNLTLESPEEAETFEETAQEGEIAVDVYQTESQVVVVSPIAGVNPEDINIAATDDTLTISGERQASRTVKEEKMHLQEIYWGAFERTVELPVPCLVDKATADVENGVLTVKIPKASKAKKHTIKVKAAS